MKLLFRRSISPHTYFIFRPFSLTFIIALSLSINVEAQTIYDGIIRHSNSYLIIKPYSSSYDDGTYARLFYDGNNKKIQFWNSDGTVPYTDISVGGVIANGDISGSGELSATGNMSTLGNLGIGTPSPQSKLHISKGGQTILLGTGNNTSGYSLNVGVNDDGVNFTNSSGYRGFNFINANGNLLNISKNGNVGIGTSNAGTWKLAVNGNIRAKEVKVETGWADYVFDKDYQLPTLDEVEKHIQEKGHLINIPSAEEVEANGIELGEMNKLLLVKIEELTLYLLEQQKALQNKESRIQHLEEELATIRVQLSNFNKS